MNSEPVRSSKRRLLSNLDSQFPYTPHETHPDLERSESLVKSENSSIMCLRNDPLLVATTASVVLALLAALPLRQFNLSLSTVTLLGLPGNLMLRLLRALVVPLISFSMTHGIIELNSQGNTTVSWLTWATLSYYAVCTMSAILLGIISVLLIQPGHAGSVPDLSDPCLKTKDFDAVPRAEVENSDAVDALVKLSNMLVTDNIVGAAVNMNVLGILVFSAMAGAAISTIGERAEVLIQMIGVLNLVVSKMIGWALWMSPIGVGSLILHALLSACSIGHLASSLALWIATVIMGLLVFGGVFIPLSLFISTGKSPVKYFKMFSQPLLLAFGTSSSAAALPLAMSAATEHAGIGQSTVAFFLPLGINLNLSGTALYEAVTAVFIAQRHNVPLGLGRIFMIAFTSSLAAIGAPAIPSAGLVTMLVVLEASGLGMYSSDLAAVLAVDFALDRIRTVVNLLGDLFGLLIVNDFLVRQNPSKYVPIIELSDQSTHL